jgi:hypothetical protein
LWDQNSRMESTGVYWIPACQILEDKGIEVLLVNNRHSAVQSCSEELRDIRLYIHIRFQQWSRECG